MKAQGEGLLSSECDTQYVIITKKMQDASSCMPLHQHAKQLQDSIPANMPACAYACLLVKRTTDL